MAGQPITLTIPAVGTAGTAYASQINAALTALEVELERKVVPADMDVNADLSFLSGATNYGLTGVKYARLALQDETAITAAAYPMALFAGSTDGELYFNDNSGRQIQITTDGAVNVSTTGGITGSGYGSSGVEIRWDGGDGEYELRSGVGTDDYADARLDDIYLSDGSTHFVRMTAQSMSADYTLTLPDAVPASTSIVQMSSAGTLTTSNTVPSVTTSTGGVTVASGQHVTLQGTGAVKHGSRRLFLAAFAGTTISSPYSGNNAEASIQLNMLAWSIPIPLPGGTRITRVDWIVNPGGSGTKTFQLRSRTSASASTQRESFTSTSSVTGTYRLDCTRTIADGEAYWAYFEAGNTDTLYGIDITYDVP